MSRIMIALTQITTPAILCILDLTSRFAKKSGWFSRYSLNKPMDYTTKDADYKYNYNDIYYSERIT